MPEQLPLRYDAGFESDQLWTELLAALGDIVDAIGLKQVAFDLDEQPSAIAHALKERDRHHFRARWIPYLVVHAPDDRAVELIASWRKLAVSRKVELTPTEKLERYQDAVRKLLGEQLVEVLEREAGLL